MRYSNYFVQDLHGLQRFYYIGVLSFTITPISTFRGAIVSEIQKCLPEAICYLLQCLGRFYHTGVLNNTTIQNFTFGRPFISQM